MKNPPKSKKKKGRPKRNPNAPIPERVLKHYAQLQAKDNQVKMTEMVNIVKELRSNFVEFSKKCIYIKDHNTGLILPLVFNPGQQILHDVAEKQAKEKNGHVRIMLLKTRRFGGSTYVEARFYFKTTMNFNRSTFIVAHEEDSTTTLYNMATLMQEKNPLHPATKKSNAKELIFDNDQGTGIKSQYKLATAKNVEAGKSQGIHYLHGSEESMWQGGGHELLSGLLQCVPPTTAPIDTEIFRESTAKGFGNSFQEDVFKSYCEGQYPYYTKDGITFAWYNPNSDWVLVFVPWFVHPWYTKPFESPERKIEFDAKINAKVFNREYMRWEDSEEVHLKRQFNLTLEQLYWRAWCIENQCRGSIDIFHQEYPTTPLEAFLSSGLNVFSKQLCDDLESNCEPPVIVGNLIERMGKTKIKLNRHGNFSIWEKYDPRYSYFMTVDTAGGVKQSQIDDKREPDPSCIDVYNHYTGKQVAQWHGHIDYDMLAETVELVGNLFNRPIACVELLNHGYTVVADLHRRKYPMWEHRPGEPGWMPNRKTKPMAIDELIKLARDGHLQLKCKESVAEMRTFVEDAGKFNAASGCHDERVDTAAMAAVMMTLLPHTIKTGDKRHDEEGIQNWKHAGGDQPKSKPQQVFYYT